MLESISIKNIALIDEAFIEFSDGLNVLTGETGAGKSIIIDSLGFALGEKTSREIIRSGEASGKVEVVFRVAESQAARAIEACGIDMDDEGIVIISRTINDTGKTSTRVNGQTVTNAVLKKITAELIDVHGQHEHQSLLDASKQLDFVDAFCGDTLHTPKKKLDAEFKRYKEIKSEIEKLERSAADKESRIEFLDYRIAELERARLKEGEDEALLDEKKAVSSADKLAAAINRALDRLYDGTETGAALDSVSEALNSIASVVEYDKKLEQHRDRLYEIQEEISDISSELRKYTAGIEQNPGRIDEIEERLNELYLIKRKYNGTIKDAMKSLDDMLEEREVLSNSSFELDKLYKSYDESLLFVNSLCREVSEIRKQASSTMEKLVTEALHDLSMENALFEINISETEASYNGADRVEILLSANKGEAVKPLAKIASGGEMSRVMLAIKSIAAEQGTIGTFIFDEIDQGVSGRAAQRVAEKMAVLAAKKQLVCVTHLPQIAAMADKHILIQKETDGEKTLTKTIELDEDAITGELSRLLGGAKITEQTKKAAAEMRELAKQTRI